MNKLSHSTQSEAPALRRIHRGAAIASRRDRRPARPRVYLSDVDALPRLAEELQALRDRQGVMIRTNARLRRGGRAELHDAGLTDADITRLKDALDVGGHGFDECEIRKNAVSIRKLEQRLKEAEQREAAAPVHIQAEGYAYNEDPQSNRVAFIFAHRPCAQARGVLFDHGFKPRGPLQLEWGRVMNTPGLAAALCVRKRLAGLAEQCSMRT